MANESSKYTRIEHTSRIPVDRKHFQQPSLKTAAKQLSAEQGMTLDEATNVVLSARREEARKLGEDAKARRVIGQVAGKPKGRARKPDRDNPDEVAAMKPIRFESIDGRFLATDLDTGKVSRSAVPAAIDPAQITRSDVEKIEARKKVEKERARQQRIQLRDSLVLRADAFAAFVLILEKKGVPAHVIDERKFAAITTQKRWDLVPGILAWLIREDGEVKIAFQAFCDAAKQCTENLRVGASKVSGHASEIISQKYRDMFLHAASVYTRKLSTLEASLDRLSTLTLDELESLATDEDELSQRLTAIGLKISDEIKRRESKKGAAAKSEKLAPVRQFALSLANDGNYPSRRQAVLAIKCRVLEYVRSLEGISMSEHQAETTIDGWLKNLGYTPSAGKQGMSASKHTASTG
ncbi:hypothetical protein [Paraburkholderia saeva]|uniref:hypothetical protein n=1 Tax=Paraburkholderia saeva TaxID=2777537 RepID=UPI001DE31807|nr:hypothetical protein [Paraburkholderia saeva]CAG4908291.1 hypothetical protein R52603_03613 [Paraburkholderia saeva]